MQAKRGGQRLYRECCAQHGIGISASKIVSEEPERDCSEPRADQSDALRKKKMPIGAIA